jgi:hypothetical protein
MHTGFVETVETQIENELRSIFELAGSDDVKEAIKAFNEKRPAVFSGR